ncbi:MAG TPA: hypothetical protein VMZ74_00030 [Ramlibacter sp.]|nr:hypothetical protein [Ramlibacter sp.]
MISIGTRAHSERRRREIKVVNDLFHKGEWMENGEGPQLSPTVFLAEQPPNCELLPHFHKQNQFQLFVHGRGSLGPHRVDPVTIHYAGAYTGYGPLVAEAEGLKYFTIRSVFDTGFIAFAEARTKMIRGPKRHEEAALGAPWSEAQLAQLRETQTAWPIAPKDGLAAQHIRLAPGAQLTLEGIAASDGQFVFVLSGEAHRAQHVLHAWESLFATPDEREVVLKAGAQGAELVCLHMPNTDPAYRGQ